MNRTGSKDGVTLIEVMIACLILSAVFAGVLTGFIMSQKSVYLTNNRLSALHEARAVLERLTVLNYSSTELSPGSHSLSNGTYVVTEHDGVKDIVLTVEWVDPAFSGTSRQSLAMSVSRAIHQ